MMLNMMVYVVNMLVITEPETTNCFSINFQVEYYEFKILCLFALYTVVHIKA